MINERKLTHIRLFLALPSSANMHKSNKKLVSAFLQSFNNLFPFKFVKFVSVSDAEELFKIVSNDRSVSFKIVLYTSCTIGIDLTIINVL